MVAVGRGSFLYYATYPSERAWSLTSVSTSLHKNKIEQTDKNKAHMPSSKA